MRKEQYFPIHMILLKKRHGYVRFGNHHAQPVLIVKEKVNFGSQLVKKFSNMNSGMRNIHDL